MNVKHIQILVFIYEYWE